jgi:GH25 family lysozyme M1 (1,4-beta-N-acetylmuramidase)
MKIKGIDVSKHQGTIDWDKVKKSGIDVAIIRCGYGINKVSQDDSQFERNYKETKRAGIKVGVYLYSYATNVTQARSEAQHVLRLLQNKELDYPVFYDLEDEKTTGKCSRALIADIAEAFCNAIIIAGYKVGIYANKNWFTNILTDARFNQWNKWVAQYNNECTYQGSYTAWQYSSSGKVEGISGKVDMDEFYCDYIEKTNVIPSAPIDTLPDLTEYVGTSIAGALNSKGYNSTFAYRKTIAAKLGITNYKGTAAKNLEMIKRLGGTVKA